MMIHLFLLCIVVILIHYCYIHYSARGRLFNRIPGPRLTLPVIGNLFTFIRPTDQLFDFVHGYLPKNYYPIVRIWKFFSDVVVAIYDPDDIKVLLTSKVDLNKGNLAYSIFKEVNIDGVFTSKVEKWKKRRKMIESSFNIPILKMYLYIMNTNAKLLINNMKSQGDVTVQDIFPVTLRFEFQVVCNSLLGFNNFNNSDLEIAKLEHAFKLCTNYVAKRATQLYLPMWCTVSQAGREIKGALEMMNSFIAMVIDNRVKYLKNKQMDEGGKNDDQEYSKPANTVGGDHLIPMIDKLLQYEAEGLIDRCGVIEEIFVILVGGYETTGVTLAFALILLAENKWAQDIAREEVFKVLDESNNEVNYDVLQKMNFLERCLKETMRLFPSGPIILRRLSENKMMSNYSIPADTDVLIDIYSLHKNPKLWSDPAKFDPDRFLPERMKNQHPYSYIPFSSGLRNCPGIKYAFWNLKVAVIQLLRNFYFEPVTRSREIKFGPTLMLQALSPAYVKFIKIDDFKAK